MSQAKNKSFEIGDTVDVTITGINDQYGIFVKMPNGAKGLIWFADITWTRNSAILASLSVGDTFKAKILAKNEKGEYRLSRKEHLPNAQTVKKGARYKVTVRSIESFGLIVNLGDSTALVHVSELPHIKHTVGEQIICAVTENSYDSEKHYNKIYMSVREVYRDYAQKLREYEHVNFRFKGVVKTEDSLCAVVETEDLIKAIVPSHRFVEPYKTRLRNNEIALGEELEFVYLKYKEQSGELVLDMRPIEQEARKARTDALKARLTQGDVVDAEVKKVDNKVAIVEIVGWDLLYPIDKTELSCSHIARASDEVFPGEQIQLVYQGENEGKLLFSRKSLVEKRYEQSLYDLNLTELLDTMGIKTNRFVAQLVESNAFYFCKNLISTGDPNEENNGKLLVDPVTGNRLSAIVDNRLRNFFVPGNYYEVELYLADTPYRLKKGSPYLFRVMSNNIAEVPNPYKESVSLSFKQHTSPNTNTSVANLLEEVGKNLYTSKKRMFFELLQNADDSAPENGVQVKLQLTDEHFVLTHDGFPFNKHDFESITSAAKSTKSAKEKKTGYKGIGFKSVFTNSESVYIKSGGYKFSFDKSLPIYNDFDAFYFHVNDIVDDEEGQQDFVRKFAKYRREFNGVKDIPWQLLPVWHDSLRILPGDSIFNQDENVSIALKMDKETLSEYSEAILEVFSEPRFMLFLRNTTRVQLIERDNCRTIKKNIDKRAHTVSLVNSFNEDHQSEDFSIHSSGVLSVNDEAFNRAGVQIKRKEKNDNRREHENYFVKLDQDGNELTEVAGIPDRIASATQTSIAFAVRLDDEGRVIPIEEELSLYAYLPMNEHRFKFPFYLNADFIPKSDREGIQSDNPWNYFLFYTIGREIVSMVASYASEANVRYLHLLPTETFSNSSQDTAALANAFNRGYEYALQHTPFVLNDINEIVGPNDIIYDVSDLSSAIGAPAFYELVGTTKHLPHPAIDPSSLSKEIFGVERLTVKSVVSILEQQLDVLRKWMIESEEEARTAFYQWVAKEEKAHALIPYIPAFKFGDEWKTPHEIDVTDQLLISTEKTTTIKPVLSTLGFRYSDQPLEAHPLSSYIARQDEEEIFEAIEEESLDALSFSERLQLFRYASTLENVGTRKLGTWSIFKNQKGDYYPLSSMCAYDSNLPEWLHEFMLKDEENDDSLSKYLIDRNEVFSKIIESHIDYLLESTDLTVIYEAFSYCWTAGFTKSLFSKGNIKPKSLLYIVEQSNAETQSAYAQNIRSMPLQSTEEYGTESFAYRWIKLALSSEKSIEHALSIITIDGRHLSEYNLRDSFNLYTDSKNFTFSLSKLLPGYSDSSASSRVSANFSNIRGYEKIFAQRPVNGKFVYEQLNNNLGRSAQLITAEQFCFLMVYRRTHNYKKLDSSFISNIRVNNQDLFIKILDRCMEMGIYTMFGYAIESWGLTLPFDRLIGTYFGCDEYTLASERTPSFVEHWADTPEKKGFLFRLGLYGNRSAAIQRRKAFKEGNFGEDWSMPEGSSIKPFLDWVAGSFQLPIEAEAQVKVLKALCNTPQIKEYYKGYYYRDDFDKAEEWGNPRYLEWKEKSEVTIYTVKGLFPHRGYYGNQYFFKDYCEESYIYFDSKHLYITADREPEAILAEVYSKSSKCPFTKEDWNQIFLVSAASYAQQHLLVEELEQQKAELERQKAELEQQFNEFKLAVQETARGKYTERGNVGQIDRAQINLEARRAAKEYLESLEDYDCSAWDPEESSQLVEGGIRYKGEPITVAITSSRGGKLHLHPWTFSAIMENPDNLLLNYGSDHCIHSLRFDDIFMDNPNVNLIFDTDAVNPRLIAKLSSLFRNYQHTYFVIENPKYSQSEAIQSFGLSEKVEGDVDTGFSLEDIFNFNE